VKKAGSLALESKAMPGQLALTDDRVMKLFEAWSWLCRSRSHEFWNGLATGGVRQRTNYRPTPAHMIICLDARVRAR